MLPLFAIFASTIDTFFSNLFARFARNRTKVSEIEMGMKKKKVERKGNRADDEEGEEAIPRAKRRPL